MAVLVRWVSRRGGVAGRLVPCLALLVAACCVWLLAAAPRAHAGTTCGGNAPTALVSGTYSGTWTYTFKTPQGVEEPNEVQQISLSWSESYDGQTGCWTLKGVSGSASLSGTGAPPVGSDCNAMIKLATDAATNFLSDQLSSAAEYPSLTQTNPATGVFDRHHWFLDEYVPNFYGDPVGVLRTTDKHPADWCFQPLNGYQPTNNLQFTGDDCHVGPYYAGGPVDFVEFPANGPETRNDSCSYTATASGGATTTETLQQSAILSSRTPTCGDVSASTTQNQPVTVQLQCTNPSNSQQLNYLLSVPPQHAASWSLQGDRLTYTPAPGFVGTDTFIYFAEPLHGLEGNTATVTITVTEPTGSGPPPPPPPPPPQHHKHKKPPKKQRGTRHHKASGACKVPRLRGRTLAAAKLALRRAHCGVGKVAKRKSSALAKGRVIASHPRATSRHKAGAKVKLTVSLGR